MFDLNGLTDCELASHSQVVFHEYKDNPKTNAKTEEAMNLSLNLQLKNLNLNDDNLDHQNPSI